MRRRSIVERNLFFHWIPSKGTRSAEGGQEREREVKRGRAIDGGVSSTHRGRRSKSSKARLLHGSNFHCKISENFDTIAPSNLIEQVSATALSMHTKLANSFQGISSSKLVTKASFCILFLE
jgi:hypothetical protein